MRRVFWLAGLSIACATAPVTWTSRLRGESSAIPIELDSFGKCQGAADACFLEARSLLTSNVTFFDGVHELMAACHFGSDGACDELQRHAKPAARLLKNGELPPLAVEPGHEPKSGVETFTCDLLAEGVLTHCQATGDLPHLAALTRWFNGRSVEPMTFDGRPVPTVFHTAVRVEGPCFPNFRC